MILILDFRAQTCSSRSTLLLGTLTERPSVIDKLIMLRNRYLRSQDEGWTNNWH